MQNQFREIAKKFTTEKWKDSDTVLSFFIGICFILLFILLSYGAIPDKPTGKSALWHLTMF